LLGIPIGEAHRGWPYLRSSPYHFTLGGIEQVSQLG
jgi:hypothetical protein